MKIYVTENAETLGIRCVDAKPHRGPACTEPYPAAYWVPTLRKVFFAESTCELTEQSARRVVRERTLRRMSECARQWKEDEERLLDKDWPKVVEDG